MYFSIVCWLRSRFFDLGSPAIVNKTVLFITGQELAGIAVYLVTNMRRRTDNNLSAEQIREDRQGFLIKGVTCISHRELISVCL